MRILILTNMYPNERDLNCGIFIHSQTKHLLKAGGKVKVIFPVPYIPMIACIRHKWKHYANIPEKNTIEMVPVFYPRYLRFPGKWFHSLACFTQYWGVKKTVKSIIKEFKPHVIHAHAATVAGYVGLILKKKYNLPLVCSLRGDDINKYPYYSRLTMSLTKKLLSKADQLLSVSNDLKVIANTIARPKREIRVVYNGCDLGNFTYSEKDRTNIRNKLGFSKKAKAIIFVGSIYKEKGIFELISAFIRLNLRYPCLHLIIVGDGPKRLALNGIVSSNNLNEKVHLVGVKPYVEISKFLSASDIFVLPTYAEGLPNVVLEAMACNLPVVATRVGGIPEVIEEGKNGILINKKDINMLTEAIEYLLRNEGLAKKMGTYGHKLVETKFSWQQKAQEVMKIYEDVVYAKREGLPSHHSTSTF